MKIKLFLKKNIKVIIAFCLGLILSGCSVYAATAAASDVSYSAPSGSGLTSNVQSAMDELYSKTKKVISNNNTCQTAASKLFDDWKTRDASTKSSSSYCYWFCDNIMCKGLASTAANNCHVQCHSNCASCTTSSCSISLTCTTY